MNIFLSGTSFDSDYGGPAVSVSRLAISLAEKGVTVGLWAPDGSAQNSELVPSNCAGLMRLGGSLDEALSNYGKPDLIHDSGLWLKHNHDIARTATKLDIPRIVSVRGMLEPWAIRHKRLKKSLAWRLYQRRDLEKAVVLHATANSEVDAIRNSGIMNKITCIPNGIDVPTLLLASDSPSKTDERQALFLSRIHPKKGLSMLVEAWGKLRPKDWRLLVVGPDEAGHKREIESLVERLNLDDVISFSGSLGGRQKSEVYFSSDLFILPTHSENFGIAIAEAMAHGLPVLTTRAAPWQELETHRCGWWVDPTTEAIVDGLRIAITTAPEVLKEMGDRGKLLVSERYDWDSIAEKFIRTYEKAIFTGNPKLQET